MKYFVLLLSVVAMLKGEEEQPGGVSAEKKLKITDILPTGNCDIKVEDKDLVTFEAWGYNSDGRRFDSGLYESKIGSGDLIKGIDEGIRGLCSGDQRSLKIHSDWAYGDKGLGNRVSAGATIIYDIKVYTIDKDHTAERKGLKINEFLKTKDTNTVDDCVMKVKGGDTIKWHYSGKLTDGTVFDTGDFTAVIDNREVIQGVNEAMKGLCVGGKRFMLMHHSYGYGSRGTGNIPPFANLIFDVHLYSIDRPGYGMETLDTKLRKASVTKENPIKTTDIIPTGDCKVQAREEDQVTWFYHAYLLNGVMFDHGQEDAKLGSTNVKPIGLNKALAGLCTGDERSVTLHPDLAFGTFGLSGKVPINSTVIYDIKVVDIQRTLTAEEANSTHGIDLNTGLKPNQKVKIEILESAENCTLKTQDGDTITWDYQGGFLDGTEFHKGEFTAALGKGQIIVGVDRGMRDMCVGERRKLTVHSDWGYGDEGRPGTIPPRATLVFNNILKNIERPNEEPEVDVTKSEL